MIPGIAGIYKRKQGIITRTITISGRNWSVILINIFQSMGNSQIAGPLNNDIAYGYILFTRTRTY